MLMIIITILNKHNGYQGNNDDRDTDNDNDSDNDNDKPLFSS